ncbi:hypothetical protein LCGC14_0583450 [marine sediment metagenome]|uniref:Uncharacterized protein n=1 Tax=marine sediment metagenome TaxID=412755 RepID=A0A0F9RFS9_9ZZZZ
MNRRSLLKRIIAAPLALLFGSKAVATSEPPHKLKPRTWFVCHVYGKVENDGLGSETPTTFDEAMKRSGRNDTCSWRVILKGET